jgi:hypothetical protein
VIARRLARVPDLSKTAFVSERKFKAPHDLEGFWGGKVTKYTAIIKLNADE